MLFSEKLNKKGYTIYISGLVIAVATLIILQLTMPQLHRGLSFAIFATIYFVAFAVAKNHKIKDDQ